MTDGAVDDTELDVLMAGEWLETPCRCAGEQPDVATIVCLLGKRVDEGRGQVDGGAVIEDLDRAV